MILVEYLEQYLHTVGTQLSASYCIVVGFKLRIKSNFFAKREKQKCINGWSNNWSRKYPEFPSTDPGSQSPAYPSRPEQALPRRILVIPYTQVALGILGAHELHLQPLIRARTYLQPAGFCWHLWRSLGLSLTGLQTQRRRGLTHVDICVQSSPLPLLLPPFILQGKHLDVPHNLSSHPQPHHALPTNVKKN